MTLISHRQLIRRIRSIFRNYVKLAKRQVLIEWGRHNEINVNGKAEITTDIDISIANRITADIVIAGQKALILEFGKGSLLDRNNPALRDYIKSSNFNPLRNTGFRIIGRVKSTYYDLDNNERKTQGNLAGKDLEHKDKYKPSPPYHIVRHVLYGSGDNGLIRDMINDISHEMLYFDYFYKMPKEIKLA